MHGKVSVFLYGVVLFKRYTLVTFYLKNNESFYAQSYILKRGDAVCGIEKWKMFLRFIMTNNDPQLFTFC